MLGQGAFYRSKFGVGLQVFGVHIQIPVLEDGLPLMMLFSIVFISVQFVVVEIDIRTESG